MNPIQTPQADVKWKSIIAVVVLLAFLACGVYSLGLPFYSIRQLKGRYEQAQRGMTVEQVESLMGAVGGRGRERWFPGWDDDPLPLEASQRIASARHYSVSTFFLPVCFEFTFDSDHRLVGRHIYD